MECTFIPAPNQGEQNCCGMLLAGHDQPVHAALHQLEGLHALLAQPLPVRHSLTLRGALLLAALFPARWPLGSYSVVS